MVAFNFMAAFAPQVESGVKQSTIRRRRKDGRPPCRVGDALQLYTGMRTKSCRKLREVVCTRIVPIAVDEKRQVVIDHYSLFRHEIEAIAIRDGFNCGGAMLRFLESTHGLPFDGWLIEW